jgi:heptose I phosphotransferase
MSQIKQIENMSFEMRMQLGGEIYRDVDGRKTLRFFVDGGGFFIKQHFGIGWAEIFKNLIQLKLPVLGARNEYLAIKRLKALNIDTMDIVGFEQRGINPAKIESYLITRELENTVSLEDSCQEWNRCQPDFLEKQILIKKVAEIAKKMHENGVNHRDFYICHFLLKKTDKVTDSSFLFLIDLHRAQLRNRVPERWLLKDLAALYFSAMDIGLTKRDILRFIKWYRGSCLRSVMKQERIFWNKVEQKALVLNGMPESKKKR